VANRAYVGLVDLLLELLRFHVQEEDRRRAEADANQAEFTEAVRRRCEELHLSSNTTGADGALLVQAQEEISREWANIPVSPPSSQTPWQLALSHLFQHFKAPLTNQLDPEVKFVCEHRLPDESTTDESILREYLLRVRVGAVEETSLVSAELARLNAEAFGNRLAERLEEDFPQEIREILAALPESTGATAETATGKRAGRGRPSDPDIDPKADRRLCEDWQAAKHQGATRDVFARERGIKVADLIAAQDREKHRRRPAE
jgi:hypothetical protein